MNIEDYPVDEYLAESVFGIKNRDIVIKMGSFYNMLSDINILSQIANVDIISFKNDMEKIAISIPRGQDIEKYMKELDSNSDRFRNIIYEI